MAVQNHRRRFSPAESKPARRLAYLDSDALSCTRRDPVLLGRDQLGDQLHFGEGRPPDTLEITDRALRLSPIALAQIPRHAPVERFEFSRGLRFAVDPDHL